ncbi:MAG: 2-succinyl-5-enolpyruvyl-6-hydroxy-3-cyclohexene-1-carboxylic-acid synthase [Acidimicrobiales bacterium]
MQQSVPSPSAVQASFASTLVDEWFRHGLRDVVVAPGSRSTPLVLALARDGRLTTHVRIDERSAAFFALGRALATRRPAAMVVTSGTAAAEVHAAVAEADVAGVPLVILSADRPPELHHVGAPQTMDQRQLYGAKVRLYEEPGVARWEARSSWRPLASRVYEHAAGTTGRSGPVHLNLAFVEPLVGEPAEIPAGRGDGPWRTPRRRDVPRSMLKAPGRILGVVGAGVPSETVVDMVALDWVVLGDATAQKTLAYYDALLRDDGFAERVRPDLVVRLGGNPASKVLAERLVAWGAPCVAFDGAGPVADPTGLVSEIRGGLPDPSSARGDAAYRATWTDASTRVGRFLERDRRRDVLDEPSIAHSVVTACARHGVSLVVGSSMPVRDVEWWAPARQTPTYANRGVNGIDGVSSTILGVAAGGAAIGLVGDLTLLHDVSALVDGLGDAGGCAVIVVVDNGGGGIFSFLAQAKESAATFGRYFATPRPHDLTAVAAAFGHRASLVTSITSLERAIDEALAQEGLSVVVARVDPPAANVARHGDLNSAVSALLEAP